MTITTEIACENDVCNPSMFGECRFIVDKYRNSYYGDKPPFCLLFNASLKSNYVRHEKGGKTECFNQYQRCPECLEAQGRTDNALYL